MNNAIEPKMIGCLANQAFELKNSLGRRNELKGIKELYNPLVYDKFMLLESKAFRRLHTRTQVIHNKGNLNPYIRNRQTHSAEVMAIAIRMANLLGLNRELCEVIAQGHDFGHAPYGHLGERFLTEKLPSNKNFRHENFAIFAIQHIENLNLLYESLLGILTHSGGDKNEVTLNHEILEHRLIMLADKISNTFSDINDLKRIGNKSFSDIRKYTNERIGKNKSECIDVCVANLLNESYETNTVAFQDSQIAKEFATIKQRLYSEVYATFDLSEDRLLLKNKLNNIYNFFESSKDFSIYDPILLTASLTDYEANELDDLLEINKTPELQQLNFGFLELLPKLKKTKINYIDGWSMLNWAKKRR